jgi:hypothetical protein
MNSYMVEWTITFIQTIQAQTAAITKNNMPSNKTHFGREFAHTKTNSLWIEKWGNKCNEKLVILENTGQQPTEMTNNCKSETKTLRNEPSAELLKSTGTPGNLRKP